MTNRLVLWSGGGRFVASKDVASAEVVNNPIRIKITWSIEDVQFLNGTNPISNTIQTITPCQLAGNPILQRKYYPSGGDYSANLAGMTLGGSIGVDSIGWFLGVANCLGATNRAVFSKLPISCDGFCYTTQSTTGGILLSNADPIQTISNGTEKVWRQQSLAHVISSVPAGCAIAITYTDNSTQEIPLNYCPTWVEVQTENTCPPETCHQCTHDGETCCYAKKEDGLIHLIDRFHVTS